MSILKIDLYGEDCIRYIVEEVFQRLLQITVENLRKGEYSKSSFDEYELLLIEEFLEIM
ncbi:MAG: hypothetical protein IJ308_06145 [Clostridia bacterium]|nr:hypothetical protein [Clostridia bacterium]